MRPPNKPWPFEGEHYQHHVKKYGRHPTSGKQKYFCRDCQKHFSLPVSTDAISPRPAPMTPKERVQKHRRISETRVAIANQVMATFNPHFKFCLKGNTLNLMWLSDGKTRRWSAGKNFYPTFYHHMSCGGTHAVAITQLARWVQGRTALPISAWHYWGTHQLWPTLELRLRAIDLLEKSDYPTAPKCIVCGKTSLANYEWFTYPKEGLRCYGGKCE